MKIGVVQMNSQDNKEKNVRLAVERIEQASRAGAEFVSLPEYVNFMGPDQDKRTMGEPIPGPTIKTFQETAKKLGVFLHCGSILEKTDNDRCYNTSVLINNRGEIVTAYRKVHLFDVDIEGHVAVRESDTIQAGYQLVTAETPWGKVGLTICYDLRFPELYRSLALQGAKIIFVPAAFSFYTGIHHWEVLLRARAIENQCYVVAAAQIGSHPPHNRRCFGSSMVVDPWGLVLARAPEEEGVIIAELDLNRIDRVRENVPCFKHRKPDVYSV